MKLGGVLNHHLSMVIAEMGHTDGLTVADAGLPVPLGVDRIDLAVSPGIPSFAQVLEAVASELRVEEIVVAREAFDANPAALQAIETNFPGVPIEVCAACRVQGIDPRDARGRSHRRVLPICERHLAQRRDLLRLANAGRRPSENCR